MTRLVLALLALGGAGCLPPSTSGPYTIVGGDPWRAARVPEVGQSEWTLSRERLQRMRSELPQRPYVERVRLGIVDPRTGRLYQARGAVAVAPDHAARLILIGPGGTTALDLWVTRERYRFTIPALKLEKRGGADLEGTRGLPIGFLRWWFLAPLDGELVLARSSKSEAAFLFRDGPATVTVRTDGERFVAFRRERGQDGVSGHVHGLEWTGRGLTPTAGSRGRYIDGEWGMKIYVFVEEVLPDEPDPDAFLDPDEQATSL